MTVKRKDLAVPDVNTEWIHYVVLWLLHNVNYMVVDEYWRKVLFIEL